MRVLCDNKVAISIVKNLVHHCRTKHVEIDLHFMKEKIYHGVITPDHVPSCIQTADILTKALPRSGMIDIHHPDWGEGGVLVTGYHF